jgi:Myb-like DNA-binding domain
MEAVTGSKEQPFTRWSDLAQRLPGRVGKQIRDRWVNHLNPNINHLPFSREDDLLLWNGHQKVGKRWVEIATKFFKSSRSENHIKNRWYSASFKKFISNEFGPHAYSGSKSSNRSPKKEGGSVGGSGGSFGKKGKNPNKHDDRMDDGDEEEDEEETSVGM